MSSFDDFVTKKLSDPKFKAEYDALESEFATIHAMIEARKTPGFTQIQHAERVAMPQKDMSKIS